MYLYEIAMDKGTRTGNPLSMQEIALLPELAKADGLLRDFDWRKINTIKTKDAVFMIQLARMDDTSDTWNDFVSMSSQSEGLSEIIAKLNGQDVNALDCFRWIVDNYHLIVEVVEKLPLPKPLETRQLTAPWQPSVFQ